MQVEALPVPHGVTHGPWLPAWQAARLAGCQAGSQLGPPSPVAASLAGCQAVQHVEQLLYVQLYAVVVDYQLLRMIITDTEVQPCKLQPT